MSIRTARGAWTKRQLENLGVAWPPRKGWVKAFDSGVTLPVSAWEVAASEAGLVVKY